MECKKVRERMIATGMQEVKWLLEDMPVRAKGVPVGRVR
jgi:hypothetical protein